MQPGIVGLRGAITAAWEDDLRVVRQDRYDTAEGKEALAFIQRCYSLVSDLRAPIQKAWGVGGHVHVADSANVFGPGPRVSQTRLRLRNHGDLVAVEAFTYADGTSKHNSSLGLDREIKVVGVSALSFVQELYRTTVDFLQVALSLDLALGGSAWLFEQMVAYNFVATGQWPTLGDVYQRMTRELAIEDSFERVAAMFAATPVSNGWNGANGAVGAISADSEVTLTLEQLHRCRNAQRDLDNFVQAVRLAVAADQENHRLTSEEVGRELNLDELATVKLGRLLALSPEVCRDSEMDPDYSTWSFLPSYNVHFFRRANSIDEYLAVATTIAKPGVEAARGTRPPASIAAETANSLPDGIVTFLMTDVVESTVLWIHSRAEMYAAMRRHDQLLSAAIEANGGVVIKERGEGDIFFAVFLRATDAVAAALDAQEAILSEPWRDRIQISVRMAILTGEADAQDRDYRSPAVNRCAKLRRRAIGNQVLVSETTYSIVADILRDDIQLVSVGKRRLEGHDRPEEIYVLRHPEVALEGAVAEDEVLA
ncbi:MAG TPA: adenylate/guanylate cyclase domain-containing protein [Candidatus Dormibacteraeota bacterium]|nr:adenylate/guanylate cyclase domain-containing protein [Candidatus Dormibacteraeota bacterium]